MFQKFPLKDRYIIAAIIVKAILPAVVVNRKVLYKVWELDSYLNCNIDIIKDHAVHEGYLLDNNGASKRLVISANTECIPDDECTLLSDSTLSKCYLDELKGRAYGWYQEDFLVITDIK